MNVEGKVVIVTGAARGIGREYVRALSGLGAKVVAGDIADCGETVGLAASGGAVATRLDVADMASAKVAVELATKSFGRLDGLINNAALYGSLKGGRFDQIPEPDWDA